MLLNNGIISSKDAFKLLIIGFVAFLPKLVLLCVNTYKNSSLIILSKNLLISPWSYVVIGSIVILMVFGLILAWLNYCEKYLPTE